MALSRNDRRKTKIIWGLMPGKVDNKMKRTLFIITVLFVIFTFTSCEKPQELQNPSDNEFATRTEISISEEMESVSLTGSPETEVSPMPKETNSAKSSPSPKNTTTPTPTPAVSEMPKETNSIPAASSSMPLKYASKNEFYNAVIKAKEMPKKGNATNDKQIDEITSYIDFKNVVKEMELFEIVVESTYIAVDYRNKEDENKDWLVIQWFRQAVVDENMYLENRRSSGSADIIINGNKAVKKEIHSVCNQYYWIENGYGVYMMVPSQLLDLYPEATFFDVQVVNVPAK